MLTSRRTVVQEACRFSFVGRLKVAERLRSASPKLTHLGAIVHLARCAVGVCFRAMQQARSIPIVLSCIPSAHVPKVLATSNQPKPIPASRTRTFAVASYEDTLTLIVHRSSLRPLANLSFGPCNICGMVHGLYRAPLVCQNGNKHVKHVYVAEGSCGPRRCRHLHTALEVSSDGTTSKPAAVTTTEECALLFALFRCGS